ncbi:MAG: efflux RND transporter permease subunit [Deltaproteobacteria bacterium]|nr:MAG: efflux RND transporter permease subunit [Deltaproteobacteria bacterium]
MNLVETCLRKPHLIASLIFLGALVGVYGLREMRINHYPDCDYPHITVVANYPGASAADIEDKVTRLLEKELDTIDLVRLVTSSTKDELASITLEFEYEKGLDPAATDVANVLKRVEDRLPRGVSSVQIFKISKATQPVITLALSPKKGAPLDLARIRQLADNDIKEDLLRIPFVANVETFGGYVPELLISILPDRLGAHDLELPKILASVFSQNLNIPNGLIIKEEQQYILKTEGELTRPEQAGNIVVGHIDKGDVYLKDVADIIPAYKERQSIYHGNGKPAIAMNILRPHDGNSVQTITAVEKALPAIKAKYGMIEFEISDTEKDLVETGVDNMFDALRDAIILTILVTFLFLANIRSMILVAVSLPFTYLLTFAVMYMIGYELNTLTLTAVILAVGLLLDDAIVVLENIEQRFREKGESVETAVVQGTNEIMVAVFSGTYSTIVVLVPIVFAGGFVQRALRPICVTLIIALIMSYIVSITLIPLFARVIMRNRRHRNRLERLVGLFDKHVVSAIAGFFADILKASFRFRIPLIAVSIWLLVYSYGLLGVAGRDLMPPMDSGMIQINFETDSNTSLKRTEQILNRIERIIQRLPGVVRFSSVVGSEPGVVSFGSVRIPQKGTIKIHFIDRFHRSKTIWQLAKKLRRKIQMVPGLKYADVFDFGIAALSSLKAPVFVMLSGPDPKVMDAFGEEVLTRLEDAPGLRSTSRNWSLDKKEILFTVDKRMAARYGMSPENISRQISGAVKGGVPSVYRVPGQDGYAIRVQYAHEFRNELGWIESLLIQTPLGLVPAKELGSFSEVNSQTFMSRQNLQPTLDIYGYRREAAISHIQAGVVRDLADLNLPPGYTLSQEGDIKQMKTSFGRLVIAIFAALVLLYFSLIPAFKSWIDPLTIMFTVPLGIIGAVWSLLISGKHHGMGSLLGFILLSGIVVNNGILLVDFIKNARDRGESREAAIFESVKQRTRPILMTSVGTSVGMLPIALEWSIGLEKLSNLAVVVIGGLMVATFLTLIYVPIFYTLLDDIKQALGRLFELRFFRRAGKLQ